MYIHRAVRSILYDEGSLGASRDEMTDYRTARIAESSYSDVIVAL